MFKARRFLTLTLTASLMMAGFAMSGAWAQASNTAADFMQAGAPAAPVTMPEAIGPTVQDFRVEGVQRIDNDTVISYLTMAKGDTVTPEKIDASLKALYATGLFSDVSLQMDGSTLVVKVDENAILDRVSFEGNDAIEKDDLEKEVQLKPRMVYTLPKVQRDVQRILDLYRRGGRFAATVDPKIVKLPQNRVDLVFEINEGSRTGIRSIKFVGNTSYSDDDLNVAISTRESSWWRFFSSTDYYDPDRMNYDKELLRKFYLREGYVDFRVLSAVAELTPDREDFFLTFTIEEGSRYKFGKINITSEIKGLDVESLRPFIKTLQGNWYNADQIDKSIAGLTTVLGDKQYAFVNIVPESERHHDTLTVDLNYTIKQGQRVYIDRIDLKGNTRTVDKVIRRQMQVAEGDPFNATKIHNSEQALKDMGFFETAKVTPVEGAQPDRSNVNVEVKEKSTGEVAVGAGFSSTDGPLGDFTLAEHNFLGQGQDARFGATISGRTQQIDTSFTEPYFLDRDLSLGGDVFYIQTDNQDLSSYSANSEGGNIRISYPLSSQLRQRLNYSLHHDSIDQVASTASIYILEDQGSSTTSSFGQTLTYDTRNSKLTPTLGFIVHLDTDAAGAGGSRDWLRIKAGGTQFYPIDTDEKWILSTTVEAGAIYSFNGPTEVNERFFLGDTTLRGFEYAGIGPRDLTSSNQDALGGDRFARGTLDLGMPLPVPAEFGLVGHLFSDVGVLGHTGLDTVPGNTLVDDSSLHLTVGVGVTWASPFGPIRLDLSEPILYKSYDKIQHISFNFGTKF